MTALVGVGVRPSLRAGGEQQATSGEERKDSLPAKALARRQASRLLHFRVSPASEMERLAASRNGKLRASELGSLANDTTGHLSPSSSPLSHHVSVRSLHCARRVLVFSPTIRYFINSNCLHIKDDPHLMSSRGEPTQRQQQPTAAWCQDA